MSIASPFESATKSVKKVPPKVWAIAVGGGVILFVAFRHSSNAADANSTPPVVNDAASLQGSPGVYDASAVPGVYPTGSGQGALAPVDFGLPTATDGAPAVDDLTTGVGTPDAVAANGSGVLTLNIVSSNPPATASPTGPDKVVKTVAPKRGFHTGHNKGHDFFLPGVGWVSKAKYDAANNRKPVAAGGAPVRKHPSVTHGAPHLKKASPPSHTQGAPNQSHPRQTPKPPSRPRTKAPAQKKTVKQRMFANPNRKNKPKG